MPLKKSQKKSQKASSTQGLPGRSPTPVLTGPSVAYLPSSNGIGSSPQSMAAGEKACLLKGREDGFYAPEMGLYYIPMERNVI